MATRGISLNGENISNWFNGPHQDYLRQQEWRAELRSFRESADELGELAISFKFQETMLQLSLVEIFCAFRKRSLRPDSPNYIRLFNGLARLNRECLSLRKYNDLRARQQPQEKTAIPTAHSSKPNAVNPI
jgi:hypothetical protein